MNSMTGYGKATIVKDNRELTLELKSVNHRFLDISTKIPRMFIAHEDIIRTVLAKYFDRGHIDVFVNYSNNSKDAKAVNIDFALAEAMVNVSNILSEKYSIKNDFNVNALIKSNDIIRIEQVVEDEEAVRIMLTDALEQASQSLYQMRQCEGTKLKKDILDRIGNINLLLDNIKVYAPKVIDNYRDKLFSRISEALDNVDIDAARLVNEVAFFVDKSNIDEEISRLYCHIDNARTIISEENPIGRKLDFLIQEFNREANTICSKSNDVSMTNIGLELKNEIEKVREQVQNVE